MKNNTHTHTRLAKVNCLGLATFTLMFFIVNTSFSQNSNEWKTQGNVVDSATFIGTTNAACLRFRSNNTERMRISEEGNIGIGTLHPVEKLQVKGRVRVDSALIARDSVFIGKSAKIDGDLDIVGSIRIHQGGLNIHSLVDTTLNEKGVLMINEAGEVSNGGALKSLIYSTESKTVECLQDINGNTIYFPPVWHNEDHALYTIKEHCHYKPRVGIGTKKPKARLDVRGDGYFSSGVRIGQENSVASALYIENRVNDKSDKREPYFENLILAKNAFGRKILQLNNDGLLRAREIKVDQTNWPDFVFHKDYDLMPLEEVQAYINTYGHLPNVPSAEEVEEDGVNLGDAAKNSMQKIEELTLYLLEVNEKVEKQEKTLAEQQKLIQQQEETLKLQQQLIEELKKETSKK